MSYPTAIADLYARTLDRLPNVFARLKFFASVRRGDGYAHWGLARMYGKQASETALAQAHSACVVGMLRSPVQSHLDDARRFAEEQEAEAANVLRELTDKNGVIAPSYPAPCPPEHLEWMLYVLSNWRERPAASANRVA